MIDVEDWAEIRRLHRAEGMKIKAIVRHLGIARNTVRRRCARMVRFAMSGRRRDRAVNAFEPAIRLLAEFPSMPASAGTQRPSLGVARPPPARNRLRHPRRSNPT